MPWTEWQRALLQAAHLLAGLALLAACGDDTSVYPGGGSGASGGSGGVGAGGGSGGGSAGGNVGGGITSDGAAVLVPNVDDDDQNGSADWQDAPFAGDNDVADLSLPAEFVAATEPSHVLSFELSGDDAPGFRIWLDGQVVLGHDPGSGSLLSAFELPGAEAGAVLQLESEDFLRYADLVVRRLDEAQVELARLEVQLWSAPLLLGHHKQPAESLRAVAAGSNGAMIQLFHDLFGARFTEINSSDIWIQDELQWATATAPGGRLDIAMDSIRDRDLDAYVKSLKAPDVQPITWGVAGTDTTEDKFGNLECTPPLTAGGVDYPFGRIYYGDNGDVGPNQILKDFLDSQLLQAPLQLDVGWLCVGHVDEYLTFVPDSSSAKGFKLLFADVDAGYALLNAMDPSTPLPRYGSSHGYPTVGSILADASLSAINQDAQADYLDIVLEQLKTELDLEESDVIRVPSLFERVPGCWYSNDFMEVAALVPGMVNLTVVQVQGEPTRLFIPDPFFRSDLGDQNSDPFILALQNALPAELEMHFVDDWYTYHMGMGEVHCGTSVSRTPGADWWTAGAHLLSQGGL